jgi:hypothetical protein
MGVLHQPTPPKGGIPRCLSGPASSLLPPGVPPGRPGSVLRGLSCALVLPSFVLWLPGSVLGLPSRALGPRGV